MKSLKSINLGMLLVVILLIAAGCCTEHEQRIAGLQNQYNDLSIQNRDLRTQFAQVKTHETELLSQLDAKDLQLASRNEEISRINTALAQKTPAAHEIERSAGGWDIGKFADRITVGSDILFPSGRANLTPKGKRTLSKIVRDLQNAYQNLPVRVYGFTDSDPIKRTKKLWKDNLDLSANRAMAVTRYLIDKGIDPDKIETVSMGPTRFIATNNTRSNKAKNRRVEIVVIKK